MDQMEGVRKALAEGRLVIRLKEGRGVREWVFESPDGRHARVRTHRGQDGYNFDMVPGAIARSFAKSVIANTFVSIY